MDMAKKLLTPEEMEKKTIKAANSSKNFVSVIAVLLSIAITFGIVTSANSFAQSRKSLSETNSNIQENVNNDLTDYDNSTTVDNETAAPNENADAPVGNETENTPSADTPTTDDNKEQGGALSTTAEIVEYFNVSANKVKKDATKVVKNYEKRVVRELKVPDILQSTADSLIETAMKDDTDPIVYETKEDIRNNFLVPNQDYVSVLKPEYLEKATCKDNGKEYEIYFLLKDEANATSGKGVGSVCDVIEAYEVQEGAPSFLTKFSTYYFDCEVKATIDKTTGRLTHIVYSTPVNLDVSVDLFGKHDATVGFTFIKDYTITY